MNIPWSLPNIEEPEKKAIARIVESGWFSMGKEVKKFEKNVSSFLGIKHAVATNNGTSALDLALKCINIKKNDEVIIPALTYIATGNAVLYNHAKPLFVDIDRTLNINTSLIEKKITDNTKAIINIDLGGSVSNYGELLRISKKYNIPLIVDGAQSFGSEYNGQKCCTHGIVNTTSFHIAKILTTIEGGMVFTNDEKLFLKAQAIRNQGESSKYIHSYLGNNYRMTDIAAAIGNSQMNRIKKTLEDRRKKIKYYKENLKNVNYPEELTNTKNCYFFFLILVKNRDKLIKHLNQNGIETRITYPLPINEQKIFKKYTNEKFPVAKEISKSIISLPIYNRLTTSEQDYIINKVNNFRG